MQPDQMREAGHALIKAAKKRDEWELSVTRQYRIDWDIPERGPIDRPLWETGRWSSTKDKRDERTEAIRRMLCDEGKTLEQIGAVYGLTRARIQQIAEKHGMIWPRQRRRSPEQLTNPAPNHRITP